MQWPLDQPRRTKGAPAVLVEQPRMRAAPARGTATRGADGLRGAGSSGVAPPRAPRGDGSLFTPAADAGPSRGADLAVMCALADGPRRRRTREMPAMLVEKPSSAGKRMNPESAMVAMASPTGKSGFFGWSLGAGSGAGAGVDSGIGDVIGGCGCSGVGACGGCGSVAAAISCACCVCDTAGGSEGGPVKVGCEGSCVDCGGASGVGVGGSGTGGLATGELPGGEVGDRGPVASTVCGSRFGSSNGCISGGW
mmetsp:Transcript_55356/g.160689  ORF Transcript_55356/g.160689 Transcript_55356/m.160689 type:complete len:252 (-) Transcript_55356:826-1581(-)